MSDDLKKRAAAVVLVLAVVAAGGWLMSEPRRMPTPEEQKAAAQQRLERLKELSRNREAIAAAAAESARQRRAELDAAKLVKLQKSSEDAAALACWHALKRSLHNPSSAEMLGFSEFPTWSGARVELDMRFRAENAYGALRIGTAHCSALVFSPSSIKIMSVVEI